MLRRAVAAIALIAAGACGRSPEQAARTARAPARADVPPDLEKRLARWKAVPMPFAMEKLAERERRLVEKLTRGPAGRSRTSSGSRATRRELRCANSLAERPRILATRPCAGCCGSTERAFDLLDETGPSSARPRCRPAAPSTRGADAREIEAYVAAHPDEKKGIYGERTVVVRRGEKLEAIPTTSPIRGFSIPPPAR
jgi:hypothetical protein